MKSLLFALAVCIVLPTSAGDGWKYVYDRDAAREGRAMTRSANAIMLKTRQRSRRIGEPARGYVWKEPYGKPCRQNDYYRYQAPKKTRTVRQKSARRR